MHKPYHLESRYFCVHSHPITQTHMPPPQPHIPAVYSTCTLSHPSVSTSLSLDSHFLLPLASSPEQRRADNFPCSEHTSDWAFPRSQPLLASSLSTDQPSSWPTDLPSLQLLCPTIKLFSLNYHIALALPDISGIMFMLLRHNETLSNPMSHYSSTNITLIFSWSWHFPQILEVRKIPLHSTKDL